MNPDSYKIIISISHHRISYEYWQRDGENKLVPLPNGKWPAPLAFYCSDTGIVIGEDAVRAAHIGTANAFDNYFERLTESSSYTIGGQTRPIRNLLLDASESIFRDFFKQVLFNRFGSLSDNRANMPLTLVCESDIKPNEKALLQGLFKDSGYHRVSVVGYDRYIKRYISESLSKEYVCDKVVVAWAEGPDLTFSIFDVKSDSDPIVKSFTNLGVDPRKDYVEQIIWERIVRQNPYLQRAQEQDAISKVATDFLSSSRPLVHDTILLSDGRAYYYGLNRSSIDFIPYTDGISVKDTLEQFLQENGISNRSRVLMLLRGHIAGNSYFEQNLSPGFSKVIKTDKRLRENTMNLIISEISPTPGPTPPPPPPPPPPVDNRAIKRKWRQIRAEAKGKRDRGSHPEVALQMLKDFLSECQAVSGVEDIIAEIENEIVQTEKVLSAKVVEPKVVHPRKDPDAKPKPPKPKPGKAPAEKNEGKTLIARGKLKEARDWYRSQGDNTMARILADIIRKKKGVELRATSIDEYRSSKNREQIERIIDELKDYVDLCEKAGIDASEYKKLLSEYRKINNSYIKPNKDGKKI